MNYIHISVVNYWLNLKCRYYTLRSSLAINCFNSTMHFLHVLVRVSFTCRKTHAIGTVWASKLTCLILSVRSRSFLKIKQCKINVYCIFNACPFWYTHVRFIISYAIAPRIHKLSFYYGFYSQLFTEFNNL